MQCFFQIVTYWIGLYGTLLYKINTGTLMICDLLQWFSGIYFYLFCHIFSSFLMFGLIKIQEMIPGNKYILLRTRFSCEIQQVIGVIWLKTENMELVDGGHLEFWHLDSSKYKNVTRNRFSMPHLVGKVILHGFLCRHCIKKGSTWTQQWFLTSARSAYTQECSGIVV